MNLLAAHELRYIDQAVNGQLDVSGCSLETEFVESNVYIEVDRIKRSITLKKTVVHSEHYTKHSESFDGESIVYPDEVDSKPNRVQLYWEFAI